ncbi:MAG: ParB/RepB/Spo0J family partition protein [Rikenellaceae bacterium]
MSNPRKTKGLGRGLDAIFNAEGSSLLHSVPSAESSSMVDINLISPNPKQPRQDFDQQAIDELAQSITVLGVIQPITVKKENGRYTIISGERRWRASKIASLRQMPVYIREVDDNSILEMAIVENIQRQDLNAMEIAISLQRLIDECNLSQEALAERVGKKRSTTSNYLRLLKLPGEIQLALRNNIISMGHARALITLDSREAQIAMLKKIVDKGLSVRAVEELVKKATAPEKEKTQHDDELPEYYTSLVENLEKIFSQNISIKRTASGGGKIIIGYDNEQDIERILKTIQGI